MNTQGGLPFHGPSPLLELLLQRPPQSAIPFQENIPPGLHSCGVFPHKPGLLPTPRTPGPWSPLQPGFDPRPLQPFLQFSSNQPPVFPPPPPHAVWRHLLPPPQLQTVMGKHKRFLHRPPLSNIPRSGCLPASKERTDCSIPRARPNSLQGNATTSLAEVEGPLHRDDSPFTRSRSSHLREFGLSFLWSRLEGADELELKDVLLELHSRLRDQDRVDVGLLRPDTLNAFSRVLGECLNIRRCF